MIKHRSFLSQFLMPWGWAALGAALMMAIFVTITSFGVATAKRLTDEGADATAFVTDKRRIQNRDSDGDIDYDYEVSFSFTVDGKTYDDSRNVSHGFYLKVTTGDRVPVRYWTKDMSVLEIEPGSAEFQALLGKIASAVSAGAVLILARLGWRRAAAGAWMVRYGVERQVGVTGHVDTKVKVNNVRRYRATWKEADGREGTTRMRRQEDLPTVGGKITILVDPRGQRDSVWKDDL